jgi:hypothetical protein
VSEDHPLLGGDPSALLKATFAAYKRAARRHEDTVGLPGGSEAKIYTSLAEALFWAVTLDEMLDAQDRSYRLRRAGDSRAKFFLGLRLVRNQLAHAVGPVTARGRAPFFVKGGGLFHLGEGWIWRDVSWLPEAPGRQAPQQRANYAEHLQGRLTYETLSLARSWFRDEVRRARRRDVTAGPSLEGG